MKRILAALVYVASVVLANVLTEHFGLVPIGFGLLVTAGTFTLGLAMLVRNIGQDLLGKGVIIGLMMTGALLSWWLASPQLAIASAVAFALSESTDMLVYTRLRRRSLTRALSVAAALGALVDTLVFLHLAGFPVTIDSVTGQMVVKTVISLVAAGALAAHQVHRKAAIA